MIESITDIEFEFRPGTVGELMCRLFGIERFEQIMFSALTYDGPDGMPWRFRGPPFVEVRRVVIRERIYQEAIRRREVLESGGPS